MKLAAWYVARNPNCAILPIARLVGPHNSTFYGYQIVHRAINAGLIHATYASGRYTLTVPTDE